MGSTSALGAIASPQVRVTPTGRDGDDALLI
jgi:hypothetical protein